MKKMFIILLMMMPYGLHAGDRGLNDNPPAQYPVDLFKRFLEESRQQVASNTNDNKPAVTIAQPVLPCAVAQASLSKAQKKREKKKKKKLEANNNSNHNGATQAPESNEVTQSLLEQSDEQDDEQQSEDKQ